MFYIVVTTFFAIALTALIGVRAVKQINFTRDCGGHLKRAADANTVPLAAQELETAIDYIERHGLTHGYTSVLYQTPDEDLGFWYQNLNGSLEELRGLTPQATELERSNVLLKLRETLLDHTEGGEKVTAPQGIGIFPNNRLFAIVGLFLFLGLATGGLLYSKRTGMYSMTVIEMCIVIAILLIIAVIVSTTNV
jgi:hypothetical protein